LLYVGVRVRIPP